MSQLPAMITAKALGEMPQFAMSELGEKGAFAALQAAGLPQQFLEDRDGYIPEHSLVDFVEKVARSLGQDGLGLSLAPYLTVADYGAWGRYVLSAPDLGTALRRAEQEMHLHSNADRVRMRIGSRVVSYSYEFALKGHLGYRDIAYSAVAVVLSIMHHYLGEKWAPLRIEFDFPRPTHIYRVEETFGCPVNFGRDTLRIFFPRHVLSTINPHKQTSGLATRQDIYRERMAGPPISFVQSVREILFVQLSENSASQDRTALSLGTSVRSLQRQLNEEGITFRELANDVRMKRALELIGHKGASVTTISTELGYTKSNNFSRAFSAWFGISPRQFQKMNR